MQPKYEVAILWGDAHWFNGEESGYNHESNDTAKHLVLPAPVGPPSSYELKTW